MISVVIVNWNSGIRLEKCVASLLRCAPGCEIVIVDNASDDHSADFALAIRPSPVLVRNTTNLGFAAANNAGWRRSGGDFVLFLNPDVECTESAVDSLCQALARSPSFWACAGRLVPCSTSVRSESGLRRLPTVLSVAAEMLLLDKIWSRNPWTARYGTQGEYLRGDREVEQPPAACIMFRRSALEAVDGFDEAFIPAWFEDVDLCKRIRDKGGRILFVPAAQFRHYGGYSLDKLPYAKFLEYYHSNQIRYFAKHHGAQSAGQVRRLVIAGMRLRAALSLLHPLVKGSTRAQSYQFFSSAARHFSETSRGTA